MGERERWERGRERRRVGGREWGEKESGREGGKERGSERREGGIGRRSDKYVTYTDVAKTISISLPI